MTLSYFLTLSLRFFSFFFFLNQQLVLRINSIFEARIGKKHLRRIYHYAETSSGRGDVGEMLAVLRTLYINVGLWLKKCDFSLQLQMTTATQRVKLRKEQKVASIARAFNPQACPFTFTVFFHNGIFNCTVSYSLSPSSPPTPRVRSVHTEPAQPEPGPLQWHQQQEQLAG